MYIFAEISHVATFNLPYIFAAGIVFHVGNCLRSKIAYTRITTNTAMGEEIHLSLNCLYNKNKYKYI